jgi:hypothetical protein
MDQIFVVLKATEEIPIDFSIQPVFTASDLKNAAQVEKGMIKYWATVLNGREVVPDLGSLVQGD